MPIFFLYSYFSYHTSIQTSIRLKPSLKASVGYKCCILVNIVSVLWFFWFGVLLLLSFLLHLMISYASEVTMFTIHASLQLIRYYSLQYNLCFCLKSLLVVIQQQCKCISLLLLVSQYIFQYRWMKIIVPYTSCS
jgi:hypothetical protein